jgi:hypothetical protein
MPQPRRTTVTCLKCGYRWRTRHQDLTQVACPKCKGGRAPAPPPPPLRLPTPGKRDNGGHNYGRTEIARYVKFLGCWTFVNPADASKRRDPKEYQQMLRELINVNRTRQDAVGRMETDAAIEALRRLGQ